MTETPRRRLAHQVIEQLQRWISLGDLSPGDRFPTEGELTARLGVSRTTLREAVGVLAHSGVLEVRQGDGTYVGSAPPAGDPLGQRLRRAAALEVYEVRRLLELETARLAAERRTDEDVVALRHHLAERSAARASGNAAAFVTADVALHLAIAMATQNAVLADLYRSFTGALHGAITDVVHDPDLHEDTAALHEALVNAIADGHAADAVAATDRLLEVDARELRGTLGRS
ncbi:MAG TPA: FadR/GntR family transcriptional regulator [Gemmatimonadales bacterium]|nr:FadR/GntR family transcriptional regulator [Gemmatimonadales bacterium]